MSLHHEHSHHGHSHEPQNYNRAFAFGIALNVAYIAVQVVVGLAIQSMALLADAGHNASDVLSLGMAWAGACLNQSTPTLRRTYGLRRTSILVSLTNAIILLIAVGAIAWEAIRRFAHPQTVPGGTLMWVAGIGVAVNAVTALFFMKGSHGDLNIRSAFVHMAADAGISLGVMAAGLAIKLTGLQWLDPAVSLVIVAVIAVGTWGLLRDSVNLALDAVPKGINPETVQRYLTQLPGVTAVHDLHIWAMSTTQTAMTAHLVKPDGKIDDHLLHRACEELHDRFGIEHVTVQLETSTVGVCRQAVPGAV